MTQPFTVTTPGFRGAYPNVDLDALAALVAADAPPARSGIDAEKWHGAITERCRGWMLAEAGALPTAAPPSAAPAPTPIEPPALHPAAIVPAPPPGPMFTRADVDAMFERRRQVRAAAAERAAKGGAA